MKFKILKGTELYQRFLDFFEKVKIVNKQTRDLVKELTKKSGHEDLEYASFRGFAIYGGISAISFKDNPGKGWKKHKRTDITCYQPDSRTKEGKALQKRFDDLPTINAFELNDVIFLKDKDGGRMWGNFGFKDFLKKGFILIDMPESVTYDWYKPHQDLIEITEKEYYELSKKK